IAIHQLLESAARRFPDHIACTLYGRSTTYAQIADQAQRMAESLRQLGAGPGRYVGMLLPNIPEYLVALQATWLTGATVLQLSPLMVADELKKWIERTDCHLLVTLDLLAPPLVELLGRGCLEHVVVASLADKMPAWRGWLYRVERLRRRGPLRLRENAHVHRFEQMLRVPPRHLATHIVPEEDVALLAPTGGTTASPKAVMLTHRNLVANAIQLSAWSREEDGHGGVLGVLPFFHAYGLSVCLLTTLAKGATVHLHPRFEIKAVLNILDRYRPDLVPAVPAMLAALNKEMRQEPRDLSYIRAVITGASAIDKKVRAEFEAHGPQHVVEGYGLSEASPVTHVNPIDERNRPGTIGLPLPDTDARIMDEEAGTKEMPTDSVGELVIRGPQVLKGYFENPTETARALRDG